MLKFFTGLFNKLKNVSNKQKEITINQQNTLQEMNKNCEEMLVVAANLPSGKDKEEFIAAVNKYQAEILRFQKNLAR